MPKVVGQDQSIYKRVTCTHCGAINEYAPNEVKFLYTGRDISGCMEVTKGFNCANCTQEIYTESY